MPDLTQPHDRFFSKIFSQLDIVEDMLSNNIPQLADLLMPGTLELCKEKFLNPELGKYYSDLLLTAKLKDGKAVYIYLLLEHKSYHEPIVAFDLLRYMIRIWEENKETPKPFIFPIVIYHGKQRWTSGTEFSSLIGCPAGMDKFVPNFHYYLYELSHFSDEEIKGTILSRVTLLLFKHIFDKDFGEKVIWILGLIKKLQDKKTALEYLRSALEYIGSASETVTIEQIRKGLDQALPEGGEELMPTLFERIKEEGRVEGLEKGRVEGRVEGLEKGHVKGLEEGRDAGLREGLLMGIQLTLEIQYGVEGLAYYQRVKDSVELNTLLNIKEALRKNASLSELEQLLPESGAGNP